MKAAFASTNAHKAAELERVLRGWQIDVIDAEYPPEVGTTFEANALGKARFGRTLAAPDAWVLGEDSGIEVDALGGAPGIYSARWAGGDEPVKMLAAMAGKAERRARYVCALAAISPAGRETVVRGVLEGRIAEAAAGSGGFGYDPVFVPEGETETAATLGADWKAHHSHRARAAVALLSALGSDPGSNA